MDSDINFWMFKCLNLFRGCHCVVQDVSFKNTKYKQYKYKILITLHMDSDKEETFVEFDEDGDKVVNPG